MQCGDDHLYLSGQQSSLSLSLSHTLLDVGWLLRVVLPFRTETRVRFARIFRLSSAEKTPPINCDPGTPMLPHIQSGKMALAEKIVIKNDSIASNQAGSGCIHVTSYLVTSVLVDYTSASTLLCVCVCASLFVFSIVKFSYKMIGLALPVIN